MEVKFTTVSHRGSNNHRGRGGYRGGRGGGGRGGGGGGGNFKPKCKPNYFFAFRMDSPDFRELVEKVG